MRAHANGMKIGKASHWLTVTIRAKTFWTEFYRQQREWEASPEGRATLARRAAEAAKRFEEKYEPDDWEKIFGRVNNGDL